MLIKWVGAGLFAVLTIVAALAAREVFPASSTPPGAEDPFAVSLLEATGAKGGLVVQVGCRGGVLAPRLWSSGGLLMQALDADGAKVRQERESLHKQGLYGKVSVDVFDGKRLPYIENLANLVISEDLGGVTMDEVMRVLAPLGVAYIKQAGGKWVKTVKPWPKDIDEWPHFLHGSDNNAVARDTVTGAPRRLQWVASPRWGRSHEELASLSVAVSAKGRLFSIEDEAPLFSIRFPGQWKLVCRDAFNGAVLWKRDIPVWVDPLRHFRSGPAHLPRRLVAAGGEVYVTLGLDASVTALDAATGKTVREYKGTEYTEEILCDGGVLYLAVGSSEIDRTGGGLFARGEPKPSGFRFVAAFEAVSGKRLWKKDMAAGEFLLPETLAVKGCNVYYQSSFGLTCLDAATGAERWRTRRETPSLRMAWSVPTLVATDEIVLLADRDVGKSLGKGGSNVTTVASAGKVTWGVDGWDVPGIPRRAPSTLRAYSAKTGQELWAAPCTEGYNSPVDIFVVDGLVWTSDFSQGRDLKTGEVKRTLPVKYDPLGMGHHRCYRDKATDRFIVTGKSGVELIDLNKGWLENNSWIRGTCQSGVMPCNGLIYVPPNACACFPLAKLQGFVAVAPTAPSARAEAAGAASESSQRGESLEKGHAYGGQGNPQSPIPNPQSSIPNPQSEDWPMYRHDAARSGATTAKIPSALKPAWSASIGGSLTQPVIAQGKVFVASTETHTVSALAAGSGAIQWQFTAGGRIDSAPSAHRGLVLFGCADGSLYCLRAADGALVYRLRVALEDRRLVAFGQVESVWPVPGAVLLQNGSLYLTCGRSSYLDGGLTLYRIEPATGAILAKHAITSRDASGRQIGKEAHTNMEGTLADVLSGDGESVFLKRLRFDANGEPVAAAKPHLFSPTGIVDENWFIRTYWVMGVEMRGGYGGWGAIGNQVPSGRIVCFDKETAYAYRKEKYIGSQTGHRADAYCLAAIPMAPARDLPAKAAATDGKQKKDPTKKGKNAKNVSKGASLATRWAVAAPVLGWAMALAQDRLIVAGPPDVGRRKTDILEYENPEEALAAYNGEKGARLLIYSTADGKSLFQSDLGGMPVFDGMAVAPGHVFVSMKDGRVVCLGGQ